MCDAPKVGLGCAGLTPPGPPEQTLSSPVHLHDQRHHATAEASDCATSQSRFRFLSPGVLVLDLEKMQNKKSETHKSPAARPRPSRQRTRTLRNSAFRNPLSYGISGRCNPSKFIHIDHWCRDNTQRAPLVQSAMQHLTTLTYARLAAFSTGPKGPETAEEGPGVLVLALEKNKKKQIARAPVLPDRSRATRAPRRNAYKKMKKNEVR